MYASLAGIQEALTAEFPNLSMGEIIHMSFRIAAVLNSRSVPTESEGQSPGRVAVSIAGLRPDRNIGS